MGFLRLKPETQVGAGFGIFLAKKIPKQKHRASADADDSGEPPKHISRVIFCDRKDGDIFGILEPACGAPEPHNDQKSGIFQHSQKIFSFQTSQEHVRGKFLR